MAFLVPKRPNATHGTPSRREDSQNPMMSTSSMKSTPATVQQSSITPSTPSLRDMGGSVNLLNKNEALGTMDDQEEEEIDEFGAMSTDLSPNLRRSTSPGRPISNRNSIVSRVSTIFTPRKKLTSLTSFTAPGGSPNHSQSSRSRTVGTSTLVEEESEPSTCAPNYSSGCISRKGFEPVGHIAKPRKRRSISIFGKFPSASKAGTRKESTSSSLFPASANVFSSSSLSLAMRKSPEARGSKRKRRASVGGGDEWGGSRLVGVNEEHSSGDEIDEIRRPSDLGPEAEVMGEELDDLNSATGMGKDKPLPHLPMETMSTENTYSLWDSGLATASDHDAPSSAMQAMNNSQIIASALQFLPTRSEVADLATVSRVFLVAARQILYGCVDLRSNADASSQNDVENKEARKKKRKALGRTLERLVGYSLQERDGELFQGTWGFLMDEWPYGWFESDEVGEVDDETTVRYDDDAESQYTAYSDSDFTTSSRNPSRASFLLDAPDPISRRHSSGSLHYATLSHTQRRSDHRRQRKQRFHTLLKTLLASVPALTTLMLPAFELGILKYHTAFGLREVTFLNRRMADSEKEGMLGWLDGIVSVLEVRLPRLIEGDGEDAAEETTVDDEEAQEKNGARDNTDNQNPVVGVTVNVESADDSQPPSDSNVGDPTLPPRKKKRKTLLIISPSADSSPLPSPAAPNFPGTSFPMPPMSPTSLSTPTPTSRPISMLFPHLCPTSPVTRSSPPLTPQRREALTPEPTGSSSRNSSPMTPLTPITPMSPVTPFTPSFYLHSSESSSVSALVTTLSPDIERRIHELGKKETLVPALRVLHGPPSLVELLVPRRRKTVREVRMNVHGTIVGGQVKVAQVVKGLVRRELSRVDGLGIDTKVLKETVKEEEGEEACTEGRIQTLAFHFTRSVDRRTMEKVLASAGAAIYGDDSSERRDGKEEDFRRDQGVNTLEVVAACTRHPNSRKTDEGFSL
ncbi:hypothetical protein L218DRAFT_177083 [Marasmius fiardii PR-910]|nr:hypothetical protein L218DRAFT_177083 [Marasmius fiardii PR-910]